MFQTATAFNADIGAWNTERVSNMVSHESDCLEPGSPLNLARLLARKALDATCVSSKNYVARGDAGLILRRAQNSN
jgi:surface protein